MSAAKTSFICTACGYETSRWLGKCPTCGEWNTLEEHAAAEPVKKTRNKQPVAVRGEEACALPGISLEDFRRVSTGIGEFDRVLGGGIVQGSLVLIGGEPGIGKSTLLLQGADNLAASGRRVLYVTGEESARQVALRAGRLGASSASLCVLAETNVSKIMYECERISPDYVVVDSVQTMYLEDVQSSAGSVTQVRECAAVFMRYAKTNGCPVFLVGHVTKAGALAGPMVLEHMVDTVLYFEGDAQHAYRILRAVKNRFGSTNEVGIFEMLESGMNEVKNPSEMFLSEHTEAPGAVVTASVEGTRPMLAEIQALVCQTSYPSPRRMATGFDYNRLALLAAVLEKRAGVRLYDQDIYLNVVGGLRLAEPAGDLPAALAIASSVRSACFPAHCAVFGEVGLTGEIRPVGRAQSRVSEAIKCGYKDIVLPRRNISEVSVPKGVTLRGVFDISQALEALL